MVIRPPEIIRTERLLLRPPNAADAEVIFDTYARDTEVTRYLIWKPHRDIVETERFVSDCVAAWKTGSRFPWIIALKNNEALIGMVEIRLDAFKAHVGYVLGRAFWGQGFATEALRAIVEWAWAQKSIYRVWALCDTENAASARVLEKVGMQREGILRRSQLHPNISDEPRDSFFYAVVR